MGEDNHQDTKDTKVGEEEKTEERRAKSEERGVRSEERKRSCRHAGGCGHLSLLALLSSLFSSCLGALGVLVVLLSRPTSA
jgi:hypothetical protein